MNMISSILHRSISPRVRYNKTEVDQNNARIFICFENNDSEQIHSISSDPTAHVFRFTYNNSDSCSDLWPLTRNL